MKAHDSLLKAERGIIIAADVPTIGDLRKLAELGNQVAEVLAIKVGFLLGLRFGLPTVVSAVNEVCDLPVIYDHQKAGTDIPAMGMPFAETCRDAGVKGVIFFPQAGPKTLEAFVSAAFDCRLTPIVGIVMTHPGHLASEGGFLADNAPDRMCEIALDLGVDSFVLPGTKPEIISKYAEGPLAAAKPVVVMMPGIGSQGGSLSIAFEAAKGHFPHAIIGSAVYKAPNPKAALEHFAGEIQTGTA